MIMIMTGVAIAGGRFRPAGGAVFDRATFPSSRRFPDGSVPEEISMISPAQCRAARTLLSWSLAKLAAAAGVSEATVDDFEVEREPDPTAATAIERAFEEIGVEFLPQDDVRLRVAAR